MNRLSRLGFIASRESAVATPEKPDSESLKIKGDSLTDLINQTVFFFFPSHVREQMEQEGDRIEFMGKVFSKKEILSLSNAVKGAILSFHLNAEMLREIEEVKGEKSLLEAILDDDDDEDYWKRRN